MPASKVGRREHGAGSIQWLDSRRVRLRIRDGEGRQRSRVVRLAKDKDHGGRGEAVEAVETFLADIVAESETAPDQSPTVAELFVAYIAHCERIGRSKSTTEAYEQIAKRFTEPIGSMRIAELKSSAIDEFYGQLKGRLAVSTIRITHGVFAAALEQAIKWDWITQNPARKATPPLAEEDEGVPLSPSEVAQLAVAAATPKEGQEEGDLVLTMAILMAALTGARRGELCGFQWDDLDITNSSIAIRRQWVPGKGGQRLEAPKSKKGTRVVYLGVEGMKLIEQYRGAMRDRLSREPAGWLLSEDAGTTPLRAKSLGESISVTAKALGMEVTTHRFRKVQATQLVASGVDVDTAARRMGHTKEIMFGHYTLGADDKSIAAAEIIESRLIEQGLPLSEIFSPRPELAP